MADPYYNKDRERLPDRDKTNERKWKYPYNKVTVTESGHEIHYDDTPGKERIRVSHKSGTYTEIYSNGDRTDFVVGNEQKVNKSGITISVENNGDISIGGSSRFLVGGGSHIEVAGDAGIAVGGDVALVSGGKLNMSVKDAYLGVRGNLNINVAGSTEFQTAENMTMKTGGNQVMTAKGTMDIASDGNQALQTKAAQKVTSSGQQQLHGDAGTSLTAGGLVEIEGSATLLQSGANKPTSSTTDTNITEV